MPAGYQASDRLKITSGSESKFSDLCSVSLPCHCCERTNYLIQFRAELKGKVRRVGVSISTATDVGRADCILTCVFDSSSLFTELRLAKAGYGSVYTACA